MGTATVTTLPTGSNPLAFGISPIGNNGSKTFFVGADFAVAGDCSGLPTGLGENSFFVSVLNANGLTLGSDTDQGRVHAFRALAIAKTADLNFGRIQVPTSGSSTVSLDANTGARSITGSLGSAGAYTVMIGGAFTLSSTTPTGACSGMLTVSLDYN